MVDSASLAEQNHRTSPKIRDSRSSSRMCRDPAQVDFLWRRARVRSSGSLRPLQNDDSIPVRSNKKKGLKSKKELREEVRS